MSIGLAFIAALNVGPVLSCDYQAHGGLRDAGFAGDGALCFASSAATTNLLNQGAIQLGDSVSLASVRSSLAHHVPHVVQLLSEEEVSGVNARRVVALMQYVHFFGDRTNEEFVGDAMGQDGFLPAPRSDPPVAALVRASGPENAPASVAFADELLKASFERKALWHCENCTTTKGV